MINKKWTMLGANLREVYVTQQNLIDKIEFASSYQGVLLFSLMALACITAINSATLLYKLNMK